MRRGTDHRADREVPGTARLLLLVVALMATAMVFVVRFFLAPAVAADGQTCGLPRASRVPDVKKPAVLLPAEGALVNFQWVYGTDETVHRQTSLFLWRGLGTRQPPLKLNDRVAMRFPAPLVDSSRTDAIPEDQMSANAVVEANGVLVSVCVDTSGTKPGRYVGALLFEDPQISAAPFAIDVTVRNRAEWIPIAAIIGGIALALMVLILSFATSPSSAEAKVLIVGVAVLTFLVGFAPWKSWQQDPTWGRDRLDWLPLAAATAIAFLGGVQTGNTIDGARRAVGARRSDGSHDGPAHAVERARQLDSLEERPADAVTGGQGDR